jgi:signal transduction histidine kinase
MTGCGLRTVLVVDDNEVNRLLLQRRLTKLGYRVVEGENGQQALDAIGDGDHGIDLVLLDIVMPGVSGTEVLVALRRRFTAAELPIIMVTAKDESDDVVESLKQGANDYVTKPIDFAVLLARMETHLRLRQLAQEKDDFLAIASHDLKNPLTVVMGAAQSVGMVVPLGEKMTEEARSMLEMIRRRAAAMQRTIEDFLDFHALGEGRLVLRLSPTHMSTVAEEALEGQAEYAREKGIDLHADLEAGPLVDLDAARIGQVVENLLGNAIKFSPPGARVALRTRMAEGAILCEIVDRGPGLTPEDMRRLFVKYARLSAKPTGGEKSSGLGHVICKRILELHGGEIGAHNNEGGGATFWFRIPVSRQGTKCTAPEVPDQHPGRRA